MYAQLSLQTREEEHWEMSIASTTAGNESGTQSWLLDLF